MSKNLICVMKRLLTAAFSVLFASLTLVCAQGLREAERLSASYQFGKAAALYGKLLEADPADSVALAGLVCAENAGALSSLAPRPEVVAVRTVPRAGFYLWAGDLGGGSWDSEGNWWRKDSDVQYFVRRGAAGDMEVACSSRVDSVQWSAPEVPCGDMSSPGNEVFPLLSPDGKRLYFSSDGLFGVGGYDLYVASWDAASGSWGDVRNMGFPFNSPADDLLFCDTPDGKWSILASNRGCGKDSVTIYVMRQENFVALPVAASELAELCSLRPASTGAGYVFAKSLPAAAPELAFEEIEEEIETGVRVSDTGAFAENNSLPSGLVYQIQMFVASGKPTVKQLKGLSPVYIIRQKSGKNLCAAGVFKNYAAAEAALPTVRRAGFPTAFVIAFEDGKPISVQKARQKESSIKVIEEEVHIVR